MADGAISSVLELLGEQLIQKVKFLQGVERNVKMLRNELRRMQFFLRDANRKQYEDHRVRNWISEIRELALDAQDTIEMFLLNAENARNMNIFSKCTNLGKRMHHLNTIGEEIEYLREELAAINASRVTYGIKDLDEAPESLLRSRVEAMRRLSPGQKDEHLVAMEDDVDEVLRESILNEENKGLSVAFLAGIGGIGKSTLAREIYNSDEVRGKFECRAWVVVSSEFKPEATIRELIMELKPMSEEEKKKLHELDGNKLQKLKEMLDEQLKDKSYFIVLDDVWTKEDLESLITAFPNQQGKASRLLITTRNKDIAQSNQYVHNMKLLDSEKGWKLLLKKVSFDGKCPTELGELEPVGRQILEKCHGLPLAINVVGGLLLMEPQTKSGWEKVLKHINSYLGRDDRVFAILELSYHNLSPQLKSCFLCLSFFREDFTIPVKRLVNTWDAQGLIKLEGSSTIDDIGRGYLNELINRSMLQIQDLKLDGRVKNCHVHDLVREVCIRKAKEEIGLEILKQGQEGNNSSEPSHKPRHRVLYGRYLETCSSYQNKHIRSLFILNVQVDYCTLVTAPSNYLKSYQLLKTLEFDGFGFRRLPNSFRLLIGLKCLRIYNCYSRLYLPSWLDHLKNLEVLDVAESGSVRFPKHVPVKMERLRYLSAFIRCGPRQLSSWKNLECLKLIGHKDWIRYSRSNLTSGCRLRELGISFDVELQLDGCLHIGSGPSELMKVKASLEKLQNLAILHLHGRGVDDMALAMPNHLACLTKLKLNSYLPKCPAATMFPPNLSHLALEWSCLHDDPMAELGKLPKLSKLKMHANTYMGEKMHVLCDGFPSLEALSFTYMEQLKGIVIEEGGGMPKLKHLRIRYCPNLETSNLPKHIKISTQ